MGKSGNFVAGYAVLSKNFVLSSTHAAVCLPAGAPLANRDVEINRHCQLMLNVFDYVFVNSNATAGWFQSSNSFHRGT